MKQYIAIGLLALACGAAEEQDTPDLDTAGDEIELGTAEQAINIGTGGHGFSTASSRMACGQPGPSGQACFIPGVVSVNVKYCFNNPAGSPFTATEMTDIKFGINMVNSDLSAWNYTEVPFTDPNCVLIFAVGGLGSGTSNIDNYMAFLPLSSGQVSLTSPAGTGHVNGSWTSFLKAQVTVDTAKIAGLGASMAPLVRGHLGAHSAAHYVGLGAQTSGSYGVSPSRRNVNLAGYLINGLTAGEKCRANSLNSVNPTQVYAATTCGT